MFQLEHRSNGAKDGWTKGAISEESRSRGPEFKTTRWPLDQLNLLPFQGWLSEYQQVLETKSKLSPYSGFVVLRQLNPIDEKGPYSLLFFIAHKYKNTKYNPTPQTYSNYEVMVALQIIFLHYTMTKRDLEGCVHYIFASLFVFQV